jgi:hypothetical protein
MSYDDDDNLPGENMLRTEKALLVASKETV